MVKDIIKTWWMVMLVLCIIPTMSILTVGYFTVPKIPACIGASRNFAKGVKDCRTELASRQIDMKTNMLTGRVLLRTFSICTDIDKLAEKANDSCSWLLQPDTLK